MTVSLPHTTRQPGSRYAFTLAETVMSVVLVGGLLVVALNTVGDATVGQQKTSDRAVGLLLARDLMDEVLRKAYEDLDGSPLFGLEVGESSVSRAGFDDVDDYHGWTASPPEYPDGTALPDRTGWERSIVVEYVDANNLAKVAGSDQDIKRITVTVAHHEVVVCSLVGVRANTVAASQPQS